METTNINTGVNSLSVEGQPQHYTIMLWPFQGYGLVPFEVAACCDEEAIEKAVAQAEKEYPAVLQEVAGIDEDDERFLYVDATPEGASRAYYVDFLNMKIITA